MNRLRCRGGVARTVLFSLAGLMAVLLALLTWAAHQAPAWLRERLQTEASALLGREVTLSSLQVHWLDAAFTLGELNMAGRPGRPPQVQWHSLHAEINLMQSLRHRTVVLNRLRLAQPKVRLARLPDESLDVADILQRLQARPGTDAPGAPPPRLALYNLEVDNGRVEWHDAARGVRHVVEGLRLGLPFISNLPADVAVTVQPELALRLDGSPLAARGKALPFSAERQGELSIQLEPYALERLGPYWPGGLPIGAPQGQARLGLALQFKQPVGAPAQVLLSGQASLEGLNLPASGQHGGPLQVKAQRLQLELSPSRLLEREVMVEAVHVHAPELTLQHRPAAGPQAGTKARLVLEPGAASSPQGSAAPAWKVQIKTLSLNDARLSMSDHSVAPAASWNAQAVQLQATNLSWPPGPQAELQLQASVQGQGKTWGQLRVKAQGSHEEGEAQLWLEQAELAWAAPYLRRWLKPALRGQLELNAQARWRTDAQGSAGPPQASLSPSGGGPGAARPWGQSERLQWAVQMPSLQVRRAVLSTPEAGKAPLASLEMLELKGLQADSAQRRLHLGQLRLQRPQLQLVRAQDGSLNVAQWLVPPSAEPAAAGTKGPAPWRVQVDGLKLDGGAVSWHDALPGEPAASLRAEALSVDLKALRWPLPQAGAAVPASLQLRLGSGDGALGEVRWHGQLVLAPSGLQQATGQLDLNALPLHAAQPYLQAHMPVHLERALLSYKGQLLWQAGEAPTAQRLALDGEAMLTEMQLFAAEQGETLLSWQAMAARPLQVRWGGGEPGAVDIGVLSLDEFYARLLVTEQGQFNLQGVAAAPSPAASAAAAPAAAAAVASATAAASAPLPSAAAPMPRITVGETRLSHGKVDFTDRFVRPNYSAALTELQGSLGRVSSVEPQLARLSLKGRAAGTALLEVEGLLNPLARPLAMDMQARASDLELAPLSPYAGKYAGYAIERGKLSMEVAYKIQPDGQLLARNQVILNQLTFGERIDSPQATKLPVLLAVALLKDRHGVIDLNVPISGSLEDPQFSVAAIIWKLIGNLLLKAVTAPFSLLAGGGSEDLSQIGFDGGSAALGTATQPVLEKVATALKDRPALKLTITGSAAPQAELEPLREAMLEERLQALARRDRLRTGTAASAPAAAAALDEPQRAQLLKRLYTETALPGRPRNLIGQLKDVSAAEMRQRLLAALTLPADAAHALALQRSVAVRDALMARGLPSERLFIAAPKLSADTAESGAGKPSALLSLAVQ